MEHYWGYASHMVLDGGLLYHLSSFTDVFVVTCLYHAGGHGREYLEFSFGNSAVLKFCPGSNRLSVSVAASSCFKCCVSRVFSIIPPKNHAYQSRFKIIIYRKSVEIVSMGEIELLTLQTAQVPFESV